MLSDPPMHACILINNTCPSKALNLKIGGAERQVSRLLPEFEKHVGRLSLITKYTTFVPSRETTTLIQQLGKGSCGSQLSRHAIIHGKRVISPMLYAGFAFRNILSLHRENRIDVLSIHIFDYVYLPSMILCKLLEIPVFYKLTGFPIPIIVENHVNFVQALLNRLVHHLFWRLYRSTLNLSSVVQALNPAIHDAVTLSFRLPRKKVVVLPNAIDYKVFSNFYKEGQDTFGYVGRLQDIKNIDSLIKAFNHLAARHEKARLVIIGDGPERTKLEELVQNLGLHNKVSFLGFLDNPKEIYTRFDFFVLPSLSEGMSNSLLEAMAVGMPILASNIPANENVVENEKEALLFDPRNVQDISEKMERILVDPFLSEKLRTNAAKKAKAEFDLEPVVNKLINQMKLMNVRRNKNG